MTTKHEYTFVIITQLRRVEPHDDYLLWVYNNKNDERKYIGTFKNKKDALEAYKKASETFDDYELREKTAEDPNFPTQEDADRYFEEMGY